jgi:hypothetical protein
MPLMAILLVLSATASASQTDRLAGRWEGKLSSL